MPDYKPTVAVDLDGVLAQYDGWRGIEHIGDPIPGAQSFVAALRGRYRVVVYTTRTSVHNLPEDQHHSPAARRALVGRVQGWLDKHGIEVDAVHAGDGKPLCAALIDDRAVPCRPESDARGTDFAYHEAMARTMFLVEGIEWGEFQDLMAKAQAKATGAHLSGTAGGRDTICRHPQAFWSPEKMAYVCASCGASTLTMSEMRQWVQP